MSRPRARTCCWTGEAGLGETLLKFGLEEAALRCFRRTLELGYADDQELMLQVGRALFREGSTRERRRPRQLHPARARQRQQPVVPRVATPVPRAYRARRGEFGMSWLNRVRIQRRKRLCRSAAASGRR